jgi:hypothetical protein
MEQKWTEFSWTILPTLTLHVCNDPHRSIRILPFLYFLVPTVVSPIPLPKPLGCYMGGGLGAPPLWYLLSCSRLVIRTLYPLGRRPVDGRVLAIPLICLKVISAWALRVWWAALLCFCFLSEMGINTVVWIKWYLWPDECQTLMSG